MAKRKLTLMFLVLLFFLPPITGCDRAAKEREEATEAKAELERTRTVLQKIQSRRDQLEHDLADISDDWEKTRSELAVVKEAYRKLRARSDQLAKERDAAIVKARDNQEMVQNLTNQLRQKEADIHEFEQWVKELQTTITEQENYIEQIDKQSPEESAEESNEASADEVVDENSV